MEGGYYSLDAEQGKTFVIVGIDITNSGADEIAIDNFAKTPKFSVMVNGQEKQRKKIQYFHLILHCIRKQSRLE